MSKLQKESKYLLKYLMDIKNIHFWFATDSHLPILNIFLVMLALFLKTDFN